MQREHDPYDLEGSSKGAPPLPPRGPLMSPPPVAPPLIRDQTIPPQPVLDPRTDDVPCRGCGYNLRGLDATAACPECGAPVSQSIYGNLLRYSPPEHLAALQRGASWVIIATIGAMVFGFLISIIAILMIMGSGNAQLASAFGVVVTGMGLLQMFFNAIITWAWWLFSTPDPSVQAEDEGQFARRLVRVCAVINLLGSMFSFALSSGSFTTAQTVSVNDLGSIATGLVAGIASIVLFFASMIYIRWLATRLPREDIVNRAKLYTWLLPVIYIVGSCVVVGPLVATIMYLILLNQVRLALQQLRIEQPRAALIASA